MKNKFEKIGLLKKGFYKLEIPKNVFINYLSEIVGNEQEVKLFSKAKLPYHGHVNHSTFAIQENISYWTETSDAKLKGIIDDLDNNTEIRVESIITQREYVFILSGILMSIGGILNLFLSNAISTEDYIFVAFSLFLLVFTYGYIKNDSEEALNKFSNTVKKIEKRYHNTVQP